MSTTTGAILTAIRGTAMLLRPFTSDIPDARMVEQFGAMRNHPAWQLGHIAVGVDYAASLLGDAPRCTAEWQGLFGMGSQPVADGSKYPAKAELIAVLESATAAVESRLPTADPGLLASPFPNEKFRAFWPTLADGVVFLVTTHYAYHLGQLSGWRRAANLPSAMPW